MNLFTIDENNQVLVNSPWIKLIPEFKALFDGRTANKTSWEKDVLGMKRLSYIYFMLDFNSPISSWEEDMKKKEALRYTSLKEEDIESDMVMLALAHYEMLQYESCRALKTYRSTKSGLNAMDAYFETVDFSKTDKMGKPLYTPNQFTANIALINKAYDELSKLEKRIKEEMSQVSTIRGNASMGDREIKRDTSKVWDETSLEGDSPTKWVDLHELIDGKAK